MKKSLRIFLAFILVFVCFSNLIACGNGDNKTDTSVITKVKDGTSFALDLNAVNSKVITISEFINGSGDIAFNVTASNTNVSLSEIAAGKFTVSGRTEGASVVTLTGTIPDKTPVSVTWQVTVQNTFVQEPAEIIKLKEAAPITLDFYTKDEGADFPTVSIDVADYVNENGVEDVSYLALCDNTAVVGVSSIVDGIFTLTGKKVGEAFVVLLVTADESEVDFEFEVFVVNTTPENLGEYGNVLVAFSDISDIHFDGATRALDSPAKTNKYSNVIIDAMSFTGGRLHASLSNGDTTEGYPSNFDSINQITARYAPNVPVIACYGNHEGIGKQIQFQQKMGYKPDSVHVINGFTFITTNIDQGYDSDSTYSYNPTTCDFVKKELDKAVAKDPTKPIFVTAHVPLKDSTSTGIARLRDVVKNYPQVYVLSGHNHSSFSANSFYGVNGDKPFHEFENASLGNGSGGQWALFRVTDKNFVIVELYSASATLGTPSTAISSKSAMQILDMNAFLKAKGVATAA